MNEQPNLERLYQDAKAALAAKDFERASNLLRQILKADVDYKDAAQLLARVIKLSRRRWYNDPRLWGAFGVLLLVGLGIYFFPKLQGLYARQAPTPAMIRPALTSSPPPQPPSTTATATLLPKPTPIPFTWKRISIGQEFKRDTTTAIVIDPKDPEVIYASMENAGIYKSIDGGISWRPAHQGLSNTQVKSLLIDSQNPNILYTGTMDGTYKTEDGGENWYRIAEGTYLLMDPTDSAHLYARDDDGIYESTDQGKNWKSVYSSKEACPGKILSWAIHPKDGKTLFIGAGEECEAGIYRSTDGGHTWAIIWRIQPTEIGNFQYLDALAIGVDKQGNYYIATTWGL